MADTKYTSLIASMSAMEADVNNLKSAVGEVKRDMSSQWDLLHGIDKKMSSLCEATRAREREWTKQRGNVSNYIAAFGAIVAAIGVLYVIMNK